MTPEVLEKSEEDSHSSSIRAGEKSSTTLAMPSARILIADNDSAIREYLRQVLSRHYRVETVTDGLAALEQADGEAPDLVLADVMMPRMDGFDLLKHLRAVERTRAIPVILLSARADEEARVEGLDAGADDYLIKPFSARELLVRVQSQLELARLRREGEKRVTRILESISDSFQVIDSEWRLTYLNAANRRILCARGLVPDELIGKHYWKEVFPPAQGTLIESQFRKAMLHRIPIEFETFYKPCQRWYAIRTYPVEEGGLAVYFHDITERKQAEEAARTARTELQSVTDITPVLLTHCSRDMRCLFVNRACVDFLGRPTEEIIGKTVAEIVGPEAFKVIRPRIEEVLQGRPVEYEAEIPYRHLGRRFMHVAYRPTRAESGEITGWVSSIHDITEWRQAKEQLRVSQDQIETELADSKLLQGVSAELIHEDRVEAIYEKVLDAAVAITAADFASMQMFYPERGSGGELRLLASRGFDDQSIKYWEWVGADSKCTCGVALRNRKRAIVADVEKCDFMVGSEHLEAFRKAGLRAGQSTPLFSRSGNLVGMLSTHWGNPCEPSERDLRLLDILARQAADLIERRQAEHALREAQTKLADHAVKLENTVAERTAELRETLAELEAFSYSIAHDMRAPLRSMQGFGQYLADEYSRKLDARGQDYLRRLVHSAARMDRLIQDVLNYSQISRAELPLRPVDVEQLLRDIIESYPIFQDNGIAIHLQRPFPKLLANEATLTQCFSNLLGNAVKFVAPGVKPNVRVWAEAHDRHARVFVQDNGIGISPDQHENIFAIFQRVSNSYDGTGIGLAIVKKAAARMNGCVGLRSELGKGSTFWIELTLSDKELSDELKSSSLRRG